MIPTLRAIAARALMTKRATEHQFGDPNAVDPIEAALQTLGTRLAAELDDALVEALRRHLGRPVSGPQELEQLASTMNSKGDASNPDAGEVWTIGAVELLWAGPIVVEREGKKVRAGREIRHVLPELVR